MADNKKGIWDLQLVRDERLQGDWTYSSSVDAGPMYMWAYNANGQQGQNNRSNYSSPQQLSGTSWQRAEGSQNVSSAIKEDGTLWIWGLNNGGQIGINDRTNRSSPTQVPGTEWSKVGVGEGVAVASKTDGTLWSWGKNAYGQQGSNDTTERSSPAQIPGTDWTGNISVGGRGISCVKTDGTLWVWGEDHWGQLGGNGPLEVNRSSPYQIPGTQWAGTAMRDRNSLFMKTDGTLYASGSNSYGQLGLNDKTPRSSPVHLPGTYWRYSEYSAAVNYYSSLATKTDGTLWTWGYNSGFGNLGHNNLTNYSSPTQIPGTAWSTIGAGRYHNVCLKSDGTLWAWGIGTSGELGQNSPNSNLSSPTQIPGTSWARVYSGNYHAFGIQSS